LKCKAARQFHWHEKSRRRKSEGGAGIPFPPTPFPSRPARAEKFSALPSRRRREQSKFAVRIFVKKCSDFVQKVPPIFRIRILGDCCLAPPKAGLGFRRDFERKFEIQKQFLPAQTEVRRAKHGQNEVLQTNLFSFAYGERQSDNFKYFDCLIIKTI
jgi:hypothetical protein